MKRLVKIFITAILLTLVTGITVFASTSNLDKVVIMVDKANQQITSEINKAKADADRVTKEYDARLSELQKDKSVNREEIAVLKLNYNKQIDQIITNLKNVTNEISDNTIQTAEKYGVTVKCEWIKVEIAGRVVMVDPLRVIAP